MAVIRKLTDGHQLVSIQPDQQSRVLFLAQDFRGGAGGVRFHLAVEIPRRLLQKQEGQK